ncbi:hypothetical protein ACNVED_10695 [Legionella sp. D16C41]|uniref:hypothetical protein n=1 Tax=Legionella sp. D16C41 TaxID=3402688 RepID=UPI003AF47C42
MQRALIKNIVEIEFESNLGEGKEQVVFNTALKKLLDDQELSSDELRSLGNIIYRQHCNPAVCLRGIRLTAIEKKEASLLFRVHLLMCLLEQFNKEDNVIHQLFDLDWFKQQRDKLVNEAKTQLPFSFDLEKAIEQTSIIYIFAILVSGVIAYSPLLYYSNDENFLNEVGLPSDALINCLNIAFVLFAASGINLAHVPSYYRQSNTFFKEQKSIETNFNFVIKKLTSLIENDNESSANVRYT